MTPERLAIAILLLVTASRVIAGQIGWMEIESSAAGARVHSPGMVTAEVPPFTKGLLPLYNGSTAPAEVSITTADRSITFPLSATRGRVEVGESIVSRPPTLTRSKAEIQIVLLCAAIGGAGFVLLATLRRGRLAVTLGAIAMSIAAGLLLRAGPAIVPENHDNVHQWRARYDGEAVLAVAPGKIPLPIVSPGDDLARWTMRTDTSARPIEIRIALKRGEFAAASLVEMNAPPK